MDYDEEESTPATYVQWMCYFDSEYDMKAFKKRVGDASYFKDNLVVQEMSYRSGLYLHTDSKLTGVVNAVDKLVQAGKTLGIITSFLSTNAIEREL